MTIDNLDNQEGWGSTHITYTKSDLLHIKHLLELNGGSISKVFEIVDDEKDLNRDQLSMWVCIIEDVKDGKMEDTFK